MIPKKDEKFEFSRQKWYTNVFLALLMCEFCNLWFDRVNGKLEKILQTNYLDWFPKNCNFVIANCSSTSRIKYLPSSGSKKASQITKILIFSRENSKRKSAEHFKKNLKIIFWREKFKISFWKMEENKKTFFAEKFKNFFLNFR